MEWILWVVVGFIILGNLMVVGQIGKEGKPTTRQTAVISLILWGLVVWAIIAIGIY